MSVNDAPGYGRGMPPAPSPATPGDGQTLASPVRMAPIAALCLMARLHQVAADPATLAHQLGLSESAAVGTDDLLRAARHLGLKNDDKRGALFPATVVLKDKQIAVDGKRVKLAPGMNLTAEIRTGERRVIEYLLSPIQRMSGESLRER